MKMSSKARSQRVSAIVSFTLFLEAQLEMESSDYRATGSQHRTTELSHPSSAADRQLHDIRGHDALFRSWAAWVKIARHNFDPSFLHHRLQSCRQLQS